ncbi:MAG: tRNA (uracil-5-)-methyltransferase [Flavobacteriales bacterium]|jgi:tRNA (uracil-5-)-methyltransferase
MFCHIIRILLGKRKNLMPLSTFNPANYDQLLTDKLAHYLPLFDQLDFTETQVFTSPTSHYRMRAEFRMWHDENRLNYVMFKKDNPKEPIEIHDFPIASKTITALMPLLRDQLQVNEELRRKLFQVEFLSTTNGDMLVSLLYHKRLDENWSIEATKLSDALQVKIIGRARKQKFVIGDDFVTENLIIDQREYKYRQFENAFTQPNAAINIEMINWTLSCCDNISGDLLELYCGNGNFTIPLAAKFDRVLATEISKSSVAAAHHNCHANAVENITMLRMSSEEFTSAWNKERQFRRLKDIDIDSFNLSTILVDPPRAGLDDKTLKLAQRFDNILYISCNPQTLADNLATLCQSHSIVKTAFFDQFPYTQHLESGVLLQRKEDG